MIGRTNTGGSGGGGLNFRVIGGTSAPANPRENDIWVNSEHKVEGFIFSAETTPPNIYETELTCVDKLSGQYINESGGIGSNEFFSVSDYVVLPKTTTHITVEHSIAASSVMYHAFYDENKNFISSVFRENKTMVYDVPSNAAYARFSMCIKEERVDNHKILATVDDGSIEDGTVFVTIGTSSKIEFNALKKNCVMVYPLSAMQYIDGAWDDVPAQSYQNGEWVDWWRGELYLAGNEYESITGGWAMSDNWYEAYYPTEGFTLTKESESMTFESHMVDNVSYAKGFLRTNKKIDLKDVNSVILVTESVALDNTLRPIKLCVKSTDNAKNEDVVASTDLKVSSTEQTFTLDVSTLNDSYYVGIETGKTEGGKVKILMFKIE